jgi:tRNA dimethylallyltransferase
MRCVGYRQVLEYLVHIKHPIFEQPHLDKAQFYDAFGELEGSINKKIKPNSRFDLQAQSMMTDSQTEALACQQMQNKALYATRQLAKRQYTWLRKIIQLPSAAAEVTKLSDLSSNDGHAINRALSIQEVSTMEQARAHLQ